MGFEQVFDDITFKDMDAFRKQIQSLVDYILNHCFWTYAMLSKSDKDHKDQIALEVLFGLLLYQREV